MVSRHWLVACSRPAKAEQSVREAFYEDASEEVENVIEGSSDSDTPCRAGHRHHHCFPDRLAAIYALACTSIPHPGRSICQGDSGPERSNARRRLHSHSSPNAHRKAT